uniref:Uncharacterized protein n=1 Tax=Arundo donax TaxID=35708 RepID=A0A0A8ZHN4_ARUDO
MILLCLLLCHHLASGLI